MFGVQTRLNEDWMIRNPEPLKYYIGPIIGRDDVVFQNNTLPRSVGEIKSSIDPGTILRDSQLTTIKGRQDLATDRIGLTTPHIRYGNLEDITKFIPQESTVACPKDMMDSRGSSQHTGYSDQCNSEFTECNRGWISHTFDRMSNNVSYTTSNHVQQGFGTNLGTIPQAMDTRLVDQYFDEIHHTQERL